MRIKYVMVATDSEDGIGVVTEPMLLEDFAKLFTYCLTVTISDGVEIARVPTIRVRDDE